MDEAEEKHDGEKRPPSIMDHPPSSKTYPAKDEIDDDKGRPQQHR